MSIYLVFNFITMFSHNLLERNSSSSNGEEHGEGNKILQSPHRIRSSSSNNRTSRRGEKTPNSRTLLTRNLINDQQSHKGLEDPDHLILWPPMLIVQNTRCRTDENLKWVGMGKEELLNYFKDYNIIKIKNSYGPMGHCGVSLLIFSSSASGYLEAECLHKNFLKKGQGRHEWENHGSDDTYSSRDRLLYCYMASEGDMELFNKHSKGRQNRKFEMKSYKMMVLDPVKKMEDNDHKLIQLGEKLRLRELEIETMKQRTKEEIEEYQNEIDYLLNYYADTIKQMTNNNLEKLEMEHEGAYKSIRLLANHCNEPTSVA